MGETLHIILHSLEESLKVFVVALILYFIISFVEERIAKGLGKKNRFSPVIASALGLVPQCGFSVVASDLYVKRHITMGTLIAIFLFLSIVKFNLPVRGESYPKTRSLHLITSFPVVLS